MPLDVAIEFAYPTSFALDVAFRASKGVTALMGPSGSGKTTLLNLIAGILAPQRGKIALEGRILFRDTPPVGLPLHARRIGYVFQDFQLFPHLTVLDNLKYGLRRSRANVDLPRLIKTLDLDQLLDRYPAKLSGGEKQRVAIGRAVASRPEYLLLDEPVNSLDQPRRRRILDYLAELAAEFQLSALVVTHDEAVPEQLSAAILHMENGKIS